MSEPLYVCSTCGRASWNPTDRLEGYCGACHEYTGGGPRALPPSVAGRPRYGRFQVPYVAEWSDVRGKIIALDPHLKYPTLLDDGELHGVPRFGLLNPPRQRECMLEGRCQVCRAELPARGSGWWMFCGEPPPGVPFLLNEPPTCLACGQYAIQTCPGIIAPSLTGKLMIMRVRVLRLLARLSRGPKDTEVAIDVDQLADYQHRAVMTLVSAYPLEFDRLSRDEFLALPLHGADDPR